MSDKNVKAKDEEIAKTQEASEEEATPDGQSATDWKAEADDLKRKWYAVTAEYENYRKRTRATREEAYRDGKTDILKQIFPIGDNLERALASCEEETTKKGLEMVLAAFNKLLADEGVEEIQPLGAPFDPEESEAIMAVDAESEEEKGMVSEVYVKGYKRKDKILRYAQVIVKT